VIAGRSAYVEQLKTHPLTRALRPDKLTLAGLEAVALAYLAQSASEQVPVVSMLSEPATAVRKRAEGLSETLNELAGVTAAVLECSARVGGGAEPETEVPSAGIALVVEGLSETQLERRLRAGRPPVISRIENGCVLMDARTVLPHDCEPLCDAVAAIAAAREN